MSDSLVATLGWFSAGSAVLLVMAYGIGAPIVLVRTLLTLGRRRRLRYRRRNDEVLATSRFTIPISLIVPIEANAADAPQRIRQLLQLRYPELEIIAVTRGAGVAVEELKEYFSLAPAEVFYRRSLPATRVRSLYRSADDPRILVVESDEASVGDALNCGVNLARYRYLAAVDVSAQFNGDALLEAMQAALEEPQRVVGVTTSLTVTPIEPSDTVLRGSAPTGFLGALQYLAAARTRLLTIGRTRLDLPPGGCPGFTIWRRDVVLEVGGFAAGLNATHADMTFRVHRHFRGDRSAYRVIHVSEPVGAIGPDEAERLARAARMPAQLLWRHRRMFFNPSLGRLGLFDLPRYAFNQLIAPWVELAALLLLVGAVPLGTLAAGELLLVLFILGLGSGVLTASALLLTNDPAGGARPASLFNLLLAGPFEYFATRPALLLDRLRR